MYTIDPNYKKELMAFIKSVCKDKELRLLTLNFCLDVLDKNQGKTFVREDFETLNVDGKEVEQDIVKIIFKNGKQVATFEEVFINILSFNLNKIEFVKGYDKDSTVGTYNLESKTISIKDYLFKYSKFLGYKLFKRERIRKLKKLLEKGLGEPLSEVAMDFKTNLYHELSHVLERKTFENGKYIKKGVDDIIIIVKDKEYLSYPALNIDTALLNDYCNKIKENEQFKSLEGLKILGSNFIAEIFNQEFAYITENNLKIEKVTNKLSKESLFEQKSELVGDCAYNIYYDIVNFIKLACDDIKVKEVKFNSKPLLEKLYKLNVNNDKLYKIRDNIIEELFLSELFLFINTLKSMELKPYSLLSLIIGLSQYFYIKKEKDKVDKYKIIAQDLLIESIKNNWEDKIYDNNIVKDKEFFIKLNQTLETIDSYILYPSEKIVYLLEDNGQEYETASYDSSILPLQTLARNYYHSHIYSFYSFIQEAELTVNIYKEEINGLEEIMTFLEKQKTLEENYRNFLKTNNEKLLKYAINNKKVKKKIPLNLKEIKEEISYENEM